jgi:hypothetical protein
MSRWLVVLAFASWTLALVGQTSAPTATASTPLTAQACPPTATLDQLIAALDAAVSGPANKDRSCMKQLLLPDVRLIPIGPGGPRVLTLDDWIAAVAKNGDAVVAEHQIKVERESYGRIAHLWSTYTTSLAGQPRSRGINSIQAVNDGQNWHVIEIVWQDETAATPIPAKYLP